jgi:hypothetical protein
MNSAGPSQKDRKRKLLIVLFVAVIFVLAVLVFLINPLEQIRRLHDRRLKGGAEELFEAIEYYYKQFFEYPWDFLGQADPTGEAVQDLWLEELVDKEVIDYSFANRSYWGQIFISFWDDGFYACFSPLSQGFGDVANNLGMEKDGSSGCVENCAYCIFEQF